MGGHAVALLRLTVSRAAQWQGARCLAHFSISEANRRTSLAAVGRHEELGATTTRGCTSVGLLASGISENTGETGLWDSKLRRLIRQLSLRHIKPVVSNPTETLAIS